MPVVPEDLDLIEQACERVEARLLIIDPIMAHLSGSVNSHRDQDVRRALSPLAKFAERVDVAVVVVRHLNKSGGGHALYRGGGSIGIIGAARVGLLLGKDPENENRRVLAPTKNNLSKPAKSLAFYLRTDEARDVARVDWDGPVSYGASDLLTRPDRRGRPSEAEAEAMAFLKEVLSDGEPRRSAEIHELREKRGIAERTFKRAKKRLGVESDRLEPGGGPWYMVPPWNASVEDQKAECQKPLGQNNSGTLHNTRSKRTKLPIQAESGTFQDTGSSGEGQSAKKIILALWGGKTDGEGLSPEVIERGRPAQAEELSEGLLVLDTERGKTARVKRVSLPAVVLRAPSGQMWTARLEDLMIDEPPF